MDMISSTTGNTTAQSVVQNKQEAATVASPPREEAAAAENIKGIQTWQQQVAANSSVERKPRPQQEHGLHCPRCNSTNTKFCYYNNNSVTQPRYFCKGCRRNWTQGGTLRNVPVGGRSRKNKLNRSGGSSSSAPPAPSSSSNDSKKINLTQHLSMMPTATAPMPDDFPNVLPTFMLTDDGFDLPSSDHHSLPVLPLSPLFNPGTTPSLLDILTVTGGFLDSGNNGIAAPPLLGTMQIEHGMIGGSPDPQMVGLLQGVDKALEPPMAGGGGLQQWAAQEQQVVGGDGSADDDDNNNSNSNRNNNNRGGASGGSSGIEYYWQGSI